MMQYKRMKRRYKTRRIRAWMIFKDQILILGGFPDIESAAQAYWEQSRRLRGFNG